MKIIDLLESTKPENSSGPVESLEKALLTAKHRGDKLDYDTIDSIMQNICKRHGIAPDRLHKDFVKKHNLIPDNWIKKEPVEENFADGRGPGRPGDSRRHGIPKKASISQLEKIRSSKTASPRKKQLAHWQINMRRGRKK